jgi:multidrug resistance efflux pump
LGKNFRVVPLILFMVYCIIYWDYWLEILFHIWTVLAYSGAYAVRMTNGYLTKWNEVNTRMFNNFFKLGK